MFEVKEIQIAPFVGMAATIGIGSDSYPATVIEVKTPRKIILQYDVAMDRACNVHTPDQKYTYFPDPLGEIAVFSLRKDGKWRKQNGYGYYLVLGKRVKYRDPDL